MPRPTHSKRPAPAAALRRRRREQLEATLLACLRNANINDSVHSSRLRLALTNWLDEADPGSRDNLLASLAETLQRASPEPTVHFSEPALSAVFARCLLQQAQHAVAREAGRAGHADSFDILSNWIELEADSAVLESLGQQMGRTPADLRTALGRLRHRFLQRVDTGLADWSDSPLARQALRRRLRAALLPSETST